MGLSAAPIVAGCATDSAADRNVTLGARPAPIQFTTRSAAVIVVDMQNDFGSAGGMFERAGIDISGIQAAVAPTARVLEAARREGVKIVYLKMGYQPDLSDLGAADSVNRTRHARLNVGQVVQAPDGRESCILVRDTWNTDIVSALTPHADDVVLNNRASAGSIAPIWMTSCAAGA